MEKLDRRSMTFAQAEGIDPLPSQLSRTELSRELRSKLWAFVHQYVEPAYYRMLQGREQQWLAILKDQHVNFYHRRVDKFQTNGFLDRLGDMFDHKPYQDVYGWLQFVLRHPSCPKNFEEGLQKVLTECRAPYRVSDQTFWPIATQEEADAVNAAMVAVSSQQYSGARTHLTSAGTKLSQGDYAGSVRESISAVESVARVLESSGDLAKALAGLEQRISIHPALKKGFITLYGYTSDEKGIRHALLSKEDADVDETDAIFFIGACASFVTYLISKTKKAGI